MKLVQKHELPFTTATLSYRGRDIEIPHVLVDTGSASTVFSTDVVAAIQIQPEPEDILRTIRGVGGKESVFTRKINSLRLGEAVVHDFEIEVGGMDYGFEINGILGMNFLKPIGAIINLRELTVSLAS